MSTVIKKPVEATWRTAKLHTVDFTSIYMRQICKSLPVGGERIVWAVVGRKWVRLCTPITNIKWRMKRSEWDATPTLERGA